MSQHTPPVGTLAAILVKACLKGTPQRSGCVTHLKKDKFKNLYFLVTNVFSVSKLILRYINNFVLYGFGNSV